MSTVATETRYTPEELLALPDEKDYELVNGQLVERKMGAVSSLVGGELYYLILAHCKANRLGRAWPADNGYQCFPDDPGKVRKPDVSFVRRGRFPNERVPSGYIRIAPDLVVEVISPNDLASEIDLKVEDYLRAGVPLVWVVHPDVRAVTVHRADGSYDRFRETDELSGEDVLPGFRLRVGALFAVLETEHPPENQPEGAKP